MKIFKIVSIILCVLTIHNVHAQNDSVTNENKKYVVWYTPSNATHVYGIMFDFWPTDDGKKIYGTDLNLNPIGLFAPFIMLVHAVLDPNTHGMHEETVVDSLKFEQFKKINGLQIGLVNLEQSIINGIDINASGSMNSQTNGVTVSLIMNRHYVMNGLTIAPIANYDTRCNGLQIGLINTSKKLKGFQIGLWNVNQKRSLPFINWCFRNRGTQQ